MHYPDLPRPDAPAPIAIVRNFVNTEDHDTGIDELATAAGLVGYLTAEGLVTSPARATRLDLDLAQRLRTNLRLALEQNHDGIRDPLPGLARSLADLEVELTWSPAGPVLRPTPARGVAAALAKVGIAAHEAAAQGVWGRLKICSFDECEWAYYDHSKNQSRQWCEYRCGNRVKTRAYRARRRAASTL